jgi:hypothetical protein
VHIERGGLDTWSVPGGLVVAVDVAPGDLPEVAEEIADAVADVTGNEGEVGVLFRSSRCAELLAGAEQQAVADADRRLASMARAADTQLGPVAGLAASPLPSVLGAAGGSGEDPCGDELPLPTFDSYFQAVELQPPGAPAEAEITAVVVLSRA